MAYINGPSVIPGLTGGDVMGGTKGLGQKGHGIYDRDDPRLLDPQLHARVAFWLRPGGYTQKDLKEEAREAGLEISGNKRILALKLAFKKLPADPASAPVVEEVQKKRKKTVEAAVNVPPGFRGCKTCGGTDHQRCTRNKCPKHPNYRPSKKMRRSDSFEIPAELLTDDDDRCGGGDWSGRPGHRCEMCGRRSENVGPRRGFSYADNMCGGCTELD